MQWTAVTENLAPQGRANLAQGGSAGQRGTNKLSPGGTTEFLKDS